MTPRRTLLPLSSRAQEVNPADKARESDQDQQEPPAQEGRVHTWEMPPTVVRAPREGQLREEDRIGEYGQPRWTAKRLFPTTRIYVVPEGKLEFEYWTRAKVPEEDKTEVETQYELEIGLPHRFQIDLYHVTSKTGSEGELDLAEQKYELRYALADWDELGEGWHFGTNLVFEHELDGAGENEYELTAGVARTVIDEKLSPGAEVKAALIDTHADRGDYEEELEIGPSLRYMPLPQTHIDFAPLIGIGGDSRAADIFLVLGWEL